MQLFYERPSLALYQGHVLDVLAELPEDSVHAVCSSPPYWGLRDYKLPSMIWDAVNGCEHEWSKIRTIVGPKKWDTATGQTYPEQITQLETNRGQFCRLCGAWRGCFGLEPTIDLYVVHTLQVLRAIRRVLRSDGTVWWNLGDSYAGSGGYHAEHHKNDSGFQQKGHGMFKGGRATPTSAREGMEPVTWSENGKTKKQGMTRIGGVDGLKPLDACLIPERVAIAAQADGWWVRSTVVWAKDNPMPESVNGVRWEKCKAKMGNRGRGGETWRDNANIGPAQQKHNPDGSFASDAQWADCPGCPKCKPNGGYVLRRGAWRPTSSYEVVLMLTPSDKYYGDGEAVREEATYGRRPFFRDAKYLNGNAFDNSALRPADCTAGIDNPSAGRNCRDVWQFPTQPYPDAHFATFPEELPRRCIAASTSERGVCPKCGAPWARVVEREHPGASGIAKRRKDIDVTQVNHPPEPGEPGAFSDTRTLGWGATCQCIRRDGVKYDPVPATVLDPFFGSGTTGLVANQMGRRCIGIELSEAYAEMAVKRLQQEILAL